MTDQPIKTLADLVADMDGEPGRLTAHIPASWMQGRTAFGGITAALALAAVRASLPDLPMLRSLQMTYMRPVSKDVTFAVELIRAGRSASFVRVDCYSDDALGAQAIFVFGAARDSKQKHQILPPPATLPAPESCPDFTRRKNAPGFVSNFQMRMADGDRLISGSDRPEFSVWARLIHCDGVAPDVALTCLADALPPAAMTGFTAPAPISTITWGIDFAHIPDPDSWVRIRTSSRQADEGYSLQDMDLRDESGRLLASAQQLVALFD